MRNPQATIRDLALKLEISISTVSRALRNAPDVNPETKRAVLELAKKLNYEPNRVAQSLRIKKTNTIGVIVPEINQHFFSAAISGIQEYCSKHHYSIMICQSMESVRMERSNIHMLVSNRVDGLLISLSSQTKTYDHLEQLMEKKIPILMFDRVCNDLNVSRVVVDDHDGAFKAVEYLIKTGCKSIAYIGGPENLFISNQRLQGYRDALTKHGIPLRDEFIIHCKDLHTDPAEAASQLLDLPAPPDAIFCFNDPVAILTLQVLKERQVAVPEKVSVVGFTNEPVSRYIEPSLTTVAQPAYEMGQIAAKLFIQEMESKEESRPVTRILKTELIIRNSTRKI